MPAMGWNRRTINGIIGFITMVTSALGAVDSASKIQSLFAKGQIPQPDYNAAIRGIFVFWGIVALLGLLLLTSSLFNEPRE
jgi:hypothetical protein